MNININLDPAVLLAQKIKAKHEEHKAKQAEKNSPIKKTTHKTLPILEFSNAQQKHLAFHVLRQDPSFEDLVNVLEDVSKFADCPICMMEI